MLGGIKLLEQRRARAERQEGQWGVWLFDWREDSVHGPAFLVAYQRGTGSRLRLFVSHLWFLPTECEDQAKEVAARFDDDEFIAREMARGRLRWVGPLPGLPEDFPYNQAVFDQRGFEHWLAGAA